MRLKVRKRERQSGAHVMRAHLERELAASVDVRTPRHGGDPLYYLTETFHRSFQSRGMARSEEAAGKADEERKSETAQRTENENREQTGRTKEGARQPGEPPQTEPSPTAGPMRKFSRMAFARGELSAAVLQGTGKMALISCLKRSMGPSEKSRNLFGLGAQERNVPSRDPDKMLFYRNFAQGAVGLVVDTLRDARRTVDSLSDMAHGTGEFRPKDGGVTLRRLYPFLDDSRERKLLAERKARLKEPCTPEEKAILEDAAVRAQAMIDKKAKLKEEFIHSLREISDRATEALAELERPETVAEAVEALAEADVPVPPPEEPPEGAVPTEETDVPEDTEAPGEPEEAEPSGETEAPKEAAPPEDTAEDDVPTEAASEEAETPADTDSEAVPPDTI